MVIAWSLRIVAIALLLSLAPGARVERALACSCEVPTPSKAYTNAGIIVAGKAVRLHEAPLEQSGGWGGGEVWEFKVSVVWKGHPGETLWVGINHYCGSVLIEEGHEYLLYGPLQLATIPRW